MKMKTPRKISLKDLNCVLVCNLCGGYYIDATTLVDCMHAFCRGCILRHFENNLACPTCKIDYKKKNYSCLRQDLQLQTLVYKLVPGLFGKEMQRREDFYRSTGVRASSSCSDDSVLGDMMHDPEEWIHMNLGEDHQFLSPDDSISLSLEYYQHHLDRTNLPATTASEQNVGGEGDKGNGQIASDAVKTDDQVEVKTDEPVSAKTDDANDDSLMVKCEETKVKDRRYLQCSAALSMTHLQKFLRMKYALSAEHKVDVIYEGEVLPTHFSLIDVAYTFKWKRTKPMRFFYRIFTPLKIRPIKIINTSSTGQKQLQIVPVTPTSERTAPPPETYETDAQNQRNKERLMAELQLQSKTKAVETPEDQKTQNSRYGKTYESSKSEKRKHTQQSECVYDYDEPDKEEMKRFAEKRDREWQMQKHLDAEEEPRVSKKRKKSKHSKGDSSKKRKLHAEITSEVSNKEESIKLKVKLTPHNGHKHKHHKNQVDRPAIDVSSKEKLLQMRQIRHKNIGVEDKSGQALSQSFEKIKKPKPSLEGNPSETKGEFTITIAKSTEKAGESRIKPSETRTKTSETQTKTSETQMKTSETQTKSSETQTIISQSKPVAPAKTSEAVKEQVESGRSPADVLVSSGKTLRSDFSFKTNATKDLCAKQTATVQIERNEMMERQAQKTFLKNFPSHADKYAKITEKIPTVKVENVCKKLTDQAKSLQTAKTIHLSRLQLQQKLDKPVAVVTKPEKKVTFSTTPSTPNSNDNKPHILNSQYHTHSGFTVSKIESGVKRKTENEESVQDKRPSLEITLINPPTTATMNVTAPPKQSPTPAKRPPPATIPLDRIKKSITLKSGISIIPKMPEKCDNIGALDLSKPHRSIETPKADPQTKLNGLTSSVGNGLKQLAPPPSRVLTPDKNAQLSNLQMLSKVASEHPNLNKPLHNLQNKPRPQMPSLQTLKIPNPQHQQQQQQQNKSSNLAKMPKLNEINKSQFRMVNTLRNMRPNQNQSIRNIPNPSLLVRQQNQNRLNSLNSVQSGPEVKEEVKTPTETAPEKNVETVGDGGKSGESTDASASAPTAAAETSENV